jgi:hypothetical protein
MQKTPDLGINLAKNRGESIVDRFISFALNTGRVLVIGTELIALGAFLYRFSLDQTLVQLHDSVQQQEAIVNLLKDNEKTFRGLQNRLSLSSTLIKQGSIFPKLLSDVFSFAPSDMNIHTLSLAPDGIRVEATVQSVDSLSNFVDKLKAYPAVSGVSLDRVSNQTETATITVDITALLKPIKGVKPIADNNSQAQQPISP